MNASTQSASLHIGETCADCGKEIGMLDASYYRKEPGDEIGKSYHSRCGDLFGIKAKDAEIAHLQAEVERLEQALSGKSQHQRAPGEMDGDALREQNNLAVGYRPSEEKTT